MTTSPAVQATFSDLRPVKGRKLCQLIFEIPVEQADAALETLGGYPQPHQERWCAIARIDLSKGRAAIDAQESTATTDKVQPRPFYTLPFPQQAALRCADEQFQAYMDAPNEQICAELVRVHCNVLSRREIRPGTQAADKWAELLRAYERAC